MDEAKKIGDLPDSMKEAIIALIPKKGKEQLDPGSYRPISLLNTDVKILAKILVDRLSRVVKGIINLDQTSFIPGRTIYSNIRRLYLNIEANRTEAGEKAVLSLDAQKAFDCIEWEYLWAVLKRVGIGQ